MSTHFIVTGCAGFIGSQFVDRALSLGHRVTGIDNFSTGQRQFLQTALQHPNFRLYEVDLLDKDAVCAAFAGGECVVHLAANADVRFGPDHPGRDLEQNTVATFHVLEAMRARDISRIAFSSTGSVYGEASVFPTPEDAPFPVQTSLYGASKLACEGMITAYCEAYGLRSWIFRFVSILGERYTHGHVVDFYRQLRSDPKHLRILGDGGQRKSYLYVQDCIDAMLLALDRAGDKVNLFNLGVDDHCTVLNSVSWICEALGVQPALSFTGGERGWVGDNPIIHLDTRRIRALGWTPTLSIRQGVERTVNFLRAHDGLVDTRQ
jgi:UDP-glucose 4-epimerase